MIAPASTLKLVDKSEKLDPPVNEQLHGFPQGGHWADLTDADTMLVIEQPLHQTCAAVGGIMASRMKIRGLLGCVVSGRVRDLGELRKSGLPVSQRFRHFHMHFPSAFSPGFVSTDGCYHCLVNNSNNYSY